MNHRLYNHMYELTETRGYRDARLAAGRCRRIGVSLVHDRKSL